MLLLMMFAGCRTCVTAFCWAVLLLFCGFGPERGVAQMNPPKPANIKPYVPKTPRILRLAKTPEMRKSAQQKMVFTQKKKSAKAISASKAWKQRVSNRFSQASQAGTVSTLLPHN